MINSEPLPVLRENNNQVGCHIENLVADLISKKEVSFLQ